VAKCAPKALRIGPGYILVDWPKCTGCGKCADACETGAITVRRSAPATGSGARRGEVVPIEAVRKKPAAKAAAKAAVGKPAPKKAASPAAPAVWTLPEAFLVLAVAFALLVGMQALRSTVLTESGWAGFLHAAYYAVLAATLWFLARRKGGSVWRSFRLDSAPEVASVLLAVAVAVGCWLVAVVYRALTTTPGAVPVSSDSLTGVFGSGIAGMATTFLLVAVVASVLEEVLLRGVVLGAFRERFGVWPALVVTALAFASLHASWTSVVPLTVLGIGLGWLAWRGRSLWPAIIAHTLYNAIFLAFFYAAAR
jgi:membrane protease YdiL (CAAX protease family)